MDFFRQNSSFLDIRTLGVTLFHQISLYGREEYTVWPRHSDFLKRNQSCQAVTLENRPMDTEQGPWKRYFCSNMAITLGKKNLKLQQPKPNKNWRWKTGCFMKISIIYFLQDNLRFFSRNRFVSSGFVDCSPSMCPMSHPDLERSRKVTVTLGTRCFKHLRLVQKVGNKCSIYRYFIGFLREEGCQEKEVTGGEI